MNVIKPIVAFRIAALLLALLPLSLLAVARNLQPSTSGLGTHQQLGFPPCTLRVLAGIRCPGCGMTTSWAHFTRGDLHSSLASNSGGCLLAIYSLVFAYCSLHAGIRGQMPTVSTQRTLAISLIAIAAVTIADWAWRLSGT